MEKQEEDHNNDAVEGKITTFASPYVLAAILADEPAEQNVFHNMAVVNENGENSEIVTDSLDVSLNDSLESTKLQAIGDFDRQDQVAINKDKPILTNDGNSVLGTEKVSDLPKSSTPVRNASSGTKKRATEKAPKPHRSQYIIERNKEKAGKRSTAKTSYAQMHAAKTRNKLDKTDKKAKTQEAETQENSFGSDSGYHLGNEEEINGDKDQNPNFVNNVDQCVEVNGRNSELEENKSDLHALDHSHLNGSLNAYHNHGPYYDVSQNYSIYDASFTSGAVSHARDYQSEHLRQSHAVLDPFPPMPHQNLSTQSAPPGVYGYQRKPLISSLHHFNGDYSLSSVLPNSEFVTSERRDKIPESSLHRKFQSEPDLGHSSSPSLQRVASVGRNSKASGSYSSLLQPSPYKPYTWKDYQNFVGSNIKPLAGGLGPNVDTDDFKEKMRKISKQKGYASMLRAQHSIMKKQQENKGSAPPAVKPRHVKEAEMKRKAALNYAKNVPKPKPMLSRKQHHSGSSSNRGKQDVHDQDITLLELLRLRHEQEKKEVDSIRKDLASKIRL